MTFRGLFIAKNAASLILIVAAVGGPPYGFYTLLRWIICPLCAYSALSAAAHKHTGWTWTFGTMAALFNPLIIVHLGRNVWAAVDIAAAVVLFISIWVIDRKPNP